LLHVCCAPCATHPIEVLSKENTIVGYFDNPNIQPKGEYDKRLEEVRRLFHQSAIELVESHYDPGSWNEAVRGLENEPEGGRRCEVCFRERLTRAALTARSMECEAFTTTLTVSRHKNSKLIHRIGDQIAEKIGVKFRRDDFKKRAGYDRSIELSKKWGFYRQDYCGCLYSLKDKQQKDKKR